MKHKFRSIVRKFFKVILLPVAVPMLLIIRLIGPWFVVRIGALNSQRIGHFAANTEMYLCERDAGINVPNKRYIDLWYHSGTICNKQLALMWKRQLIIGPSLLLLLLDRLNGFLPGHECHRIGNNTQGDRDVHNLLGHFPHHLRFLPHEEKRGRAGIHALGIPDGVPFVCLNVREGAYLEKTSPEHNWSYHDYRDSNIADYVWAAQEIVRLGYHVIRMGAIVKDPFPISYPMIIDYATNGMRNEFMDIYLAAKCDFFISTGTGLDSIPFVFRRPILFVNLMPIEHISTFLDYSITILKKHKSLRQNRLMTFREIFQSGAGLFDSSQRFQAAGIELIENSPEEITAATLEMEGRLNGTWQSTKEDEELQKRFWDIFPKKRVSPYNSMPLHGEIRSRIGAEFLRQNKALLD